jgi:hypothetical protein
MAIWLGRRNNSNLRLAALGSDKGERRDVMRLLALFQKVLGT